jgi:flagellar motor switch protein FliN
MTPPSTSVATAPAVSAETLVELVTTATDDFPAGGLQAGPADSQDGLGELLPGPDAAVVVMPVVGAPRRELFVIVAPSLMTSMGASGVAELPPIVERTFLELAGGAELDVAALRSGIGAEMLVDLPHSGRGDGGLMVAAGAFAGVDHVATVGVAVHPVDATLDTPSDDVAPDDRPSDSLDAHELARPDSVGEEPTAMDLPTVAAPRAAHVAAPVPSGGRGLDLLGHVEMHVVAELGRTRMTVADLLGLAPGAVVELDRAAGSPIDLLVNGTLIARGEVVVIDEEFGLRISEIVDGDAH